MHLAHHHVRPGACRRIATTGQYGEPPVYTCVMERARKFAVLATTAALIGGCGLKGPLYLPERSAPVTAAQTQPSSQDPSAATGEAPATQTERKRARGASIPPTPQSQKEVVRRAGATDDSARSDEAEPQRP